MLRPGTEIMMKTVITWPLFLRVVIVLHRILLEQPILLVGDTGCGKTAFWRLLECLLGRPVVRPRFTFQSLTIDTGVTRAEVEQFKNSLSQTEVNMVLLDEFNTSESTPYFENFVLASHRCHNLRVIGAIIPHQLIDPIASAFAKVGMKQSLRISLPEKCLIHRGQPRLYDCSSLKYFVHELSPRSDSVILNWNPIKIHQTDVS
jgi:hypothetical protein